MITENIESIGRILPVPTNLITEELAGLHGSRVLQDMREIISLYDVYEKGVAFTPSSSEDYVPADLRYRRSSAILDKEVRFLFSKPPEFTVKAQTTDAAPTDEQKEQLAIVQQLVDNVLEANSFNLKLIKGARDAFIGRRVAMVLNFNADGISISCIPSLEFIYDVDSSNADRMTKLVIFYNTNDEKSLQDQRIYRKRYSMEDDGFCHMEEAIFDGSGQLVESIIEDTALRFTFIPAVVVVNDGLTGDLQGVSEIEAIAGYESWYSKLANADMDSERMGMNPIKYAIDASPESTKNLPVSAGAFWDLQSDQNTDGKTAQVGVLKSDTTYTGALGTTLDRLKQAMYDQLAVPNVSPDAMQGVVTSGKTLKAIYWDLIVRCDEKMLTWRPALKFIAKCIIEGAKLYPESYAAYIEDKLPDIEYEVIVDNQYSLPEDEQEEKQTDLSEVESQVMSRRSYMKKWRGLTDDEAEAELEQIARENEIMNSAYGFSGAGMEPTVEEPDDNGSQTSPDDPNAGGQVTGTGTSQNTSTSNSGTTTED